jgi:gamma-glutamyltranspeptidase/glutathione hydrolase
VNGVPRLTFLVFMALFVLVVHKAESATQTATPDLSPLRWGKEELGRFNQYMQQAEHDNKPAVGRHGAVTGTYSAPAMRSGLEALRQGGSAADAALTTALTQVSLCGGAWVSYTGILSMVYYDATSGKVYDLNAGYNTVLGDDDPLTIPAANGILDDPYGGKPSGRATLVPGFMAGVQAAHDRFGKLPFRTLFQPAIYYAETGFEVSPYLAEFIQSRKDVLTRRPKTRRIFTNKEGQLLKAGDLLWQPELGQTLRLVSEQGAQYMYEGAWADRFVAAVRSEGGKMTCEDLANFKVIWSEPVRGKFGNYEVFVHGLPANGGVNTIEALRLYELAGLTKKGRSVDSGDALFWLAQVQKAQSLSFLPPEVFPQWEKQLGVDLTLSSRLREETTRKLWRLMEAGKFPLAQAPKESEGKHSDVVVAIDRWGNIAAIVHSINSVMWGKTGIFVDGVSVNDSASIQQRAVAVAGRAKRLPDPTNPAIVLRDGKAVLGCGSMGSGLHSKTLQCLVNVLDFNMSPKEAIDAPYLLFPRYAADGKQAQRVAKGAFPAHTLERARELGLVIEEVENSRYAQGLWVAVRIDPKTKRYEAAAPKVTNGRALAY